MRFIAKGATSQSLYVEVLNSSSTTGARLTGLVFNTSSLTAYYVRNQGSATAITLATLAAANSAWSSGGFKEVDATNMPGVYRVDVPDAAFASGADSVVVTLKGATNMVQVSEEVQLTAINPQDSVRAGMTALPNAAAEAAGGLYTRGTGAGQINQNNNGNIDVNAVRINAVATTSVTTVNANVGSTQPLNFTGTAGSALVKSDAIDLAGTTLTGRDIGASVLLSAGTGTGQLDFTSGVVKANLAQILGTALTETAGQIAAAFKQFFNIASPTSTMNTITTVTTTTTATNLTTNNDKTGYALTAGEKTTIEGGVWDVTLSGHLTAGTTGAALNGASSAGDPWGTALPGAYGAGTAGNLVGNNLTGNAYTRLGAPVGASISADIAAVQADTDNVQTRLPTALVSGRMDSSVGAMAAGVVTAAAVATNAIDADALATDAVTEIAAGVATGSAPTAADNAAAVWNAAAASFNTAGSMGQKLNAAGGAADPLTNTVPGSYAANTAGYALGTLPSGVGSVRYVYTVHSGSDAGPLIGAGVSVWITSDSAGNTIVAGPLITNDLSQVTFFLNPGVFYFWRQHAGWNFVDPDIQVVS